MKNDITSWQATNLPERVCKVCGRAFAPMYRNQVYCCVACRRQVYGEPRPIWPSNQSVDIAAETASKAKAEGASYGQHVGRRMLITVSNKPDSPLGPLENKQEGE